MVDTIFPGPDTSGPAEMDLDALRPAVFIYCLCKDISFDLPQVAEIMQRRLFNRAKCDFVIKWIKLFILLIDPYVISFVMEWKCPVIGSAAVLSANGEVEQEIVRLFEWVFKITG